ncbi:MAG: YdeI family protein [Weeksellaceae bacterium]
MKSKPLNQPILPFASAKAFETWLKENHASSDGVWIQIFKKATGKPTVDHPGALDVALCYGWIDGQSKKYNEESYLQKFTPRRARSMWSKINIGKVEKLIKDGKMQPSGQAEIDRAKADGRWDQAYDSPSNMKAPADFLKELEKHPKAKAFYETLNKTNLYAFHWRLQTSKKPETRERRMKQFLEMLERGEKFH